MAKYWILGAALSLMAWGDHSSAQDYGFDFGEDQVMAYCRATSASTGDAWACRDAYRRDFERVARIPIGQSINVGQILTPVVTACRTRHFPAWDAIRRCTERQVAPAIRVDAFQAAHPAMQVVSEICLELFSPDLARVEACLTGG